MNKQEYERFKVLKKDIIRNWEEYNNLLDKYLEMVYNPIKERRVREGIYYYGK